MKLYKEVLIESAEQAESLPEGTVAISELFAPEVFTKDGGSWLGTHGPGEFTNLSAVGLTALMPIEAKEEWAVSHDRDAPAWSSVTQERAQSPGVDETAFVRYVTPWTPTEEA